MDIREDDIELPPTFLDFNAMVHHQFIERNESPLRYRLIFDRRCRGIVTSDVLGKGLSREANASMW